MKLPTTLRVGLLAAMLAFFSNLALIGFIHWRTYHDSIEAVRQQVVEQASALDDVYASGGRRALDKAIRDTLAAGDLAQRVPISGSGDAFDGLARQINRMLDRIAALMEELRLLTDSLAHDLRSPVGRLRARVEAALAADDEKKRDALLGGVLQEADSLMRILTTVLEIGRSEALASRRQFGPLDPAEL